MCSNRAYNLIKKLCRFSSRLIESIIWEKESESENERERKGFCWRQVFAGPRCGSWVCGEARRLRDHKKMIRFVFHCTMCILTSIFSFQPNKLRHILKVASWSIIQHIFVPTCSVGRKTWFWRKPWLSNSKFGISGSFWPILSGPKIMFLVPENEERNKF